MPTRAVLITFEASDPNEPQQFFIGQGNRLPAMECLLLQPTPGRRDGKMQAIDLTGATVTFQMSGGDGCCGSSSVTLTGTVTIEDAKGGAVSFSWGSNDTAMPGTYRATWTVTKAGVALDFPNDGYILVRIRPKVGP